MNRIIPILPCPSITEQVKFYESLGFHTVEMFTSPNPYAVVQYDTIVLHFYGSKKMVPNENASMCYVQVDDVDSLYELFIKGLKETTGKIPRAGLPRLTKLKDLTSDRRFTLTDTGGNTLYIGMPHTAKVDENPFFRSLESAEHQQHFGTVYNLLYSKEDVTLAAQTLEKYFPDDVTLIKLPPMDKAKLLLLALDIQFQQHETIDKRLDATLQGLQALCNDTPEDWAKIETRYHELFEQA